ncbi:ABC transporter substrate-binding protein [Arcobacter sp. KX21116]|uniref:ABC transporter substrate-binding protein n=1 Tax=Arcobacter iocasae TaxID=2906515 RepID=UPI0035D411B7|tara:strand:+ start:72070 stop:73218 length:1149 start_codon:yes stop_codon:yes gene_type:complete
MKFLLLSFILLSFVKAELLNVNILYLEQKIQKPPVLSNVIADPDDLGIKGAELSIKDSNKSAKFLNQNFTLEKTISFDKKELITSFEKFINEGNSFVILNVEDDFLKELLNNPLSKKALLFNASSQTTSLRQDYCQQNLLHTAPSNAMLYDGLAQFLVKRNFKDIFLLSGKNPKDVEITKDIKRAVKKFGLKIVKEKVWENNTDIRRKAGAEFPSFTQADDYDVLVVADYYGDFGEFLYFNTWLPRPIAGTQGLKPVLWHRVIEAWGAAQMQKRFEKFASRWMQSNDFSNWLAVRTIVNSVMNTKAKDLNTNMNYIHSKDFELGAYLGRKVSFRDYNGQIRLPISLVQPRALISTSPQVGFLHPVTDLDTLGIAPFEMKCKN